MGPCWQKIGFLHKILKEILTLKIPLSLSPATVRRLLSASQCTHASAKQIKVGSTCVKISTGNILRFHWFFTNQKKRPMGSCWQKMGFFLKILKEIFTIKLHLSLPSYCPPFVVCQSVYTNIGSRKSKQSQLAFNFQYENMIRIHWIFTTQKKRPMGSCWQKMGFFLKILQEIFTFKLHLSLPSYCPPFVMCQSVYTNIGSRKSKQSPLAFKFQYENIIRFQWFFTN